MPFTSTGYLFQITDGQLIYNGPNAWSKKVAVDPFLEEAVWDSAFDDLTTALNNVYRLDGVARPSQNLHMNGKRITNVGEASSDTDAMTKGQVEAVSGVFFPASAVGTQADAVVISPNPAITSSQLVAGLVIRFFVKTQNTAAVTLNISNLGAKKLLKADGSEIGGGELRVGSPVHAMYNGTDFRLVAGLGAGGGTASRNLNVSRLTSTSRSTPAASTLLTTTLTPSNSARPIRIGVSIVVSRWQAMQYELTRQIGSGSQTDLTPDIDSADALVVDARPATGNGSGPYQVLFWGQAQHHITGNVSASAKECSPKSCSHHLRRHIPVC